MKKMLTFIPLGIGISAAIIYVINVFNYRVINNSVAMIQILSNLRIYLYISIGGFVLYFLIKILLSLSKYKVSNENIIEKDYEPFEVDSSTPVQIEEEIKRPIKENTIIKEVVLTGNKYCSSCGEKIFDTDTYCKTCGSYQKDKKSGINPVLKNIINVLEIVILILILYFLLNMLFEYKEKTDSSFKSPFRIQMTKWNALFLFFAIFYVVAYIRKIKYWFYIFEYVIINITIIVV